MPTYDVQLWRNKASGGTPISADRLTHMETGIQVANTAADAAQSDATTALSRIGTGFGITVAALASRPTGKPNGHIWINSATGIPYVRLDSSWVPVSRHVRIAAGALGIAAGFVGGATHVASIGSIAVQAEAPLASLEFEASVLGMGGNGTADPLFYGAWHYDGQRVVPATLAHPNGAFHFRGAGTATGVGAGNGGNGGIVKGWWDSPVAGSHAVTVNFWPSTSISWDFFGGYYQVTGWLANVAAT